MDRRVCVLLLAVAVAGCGREGSGEEATETAVTSSWSVTQTVQDRVLSITGFSGPEAVRFDETQDVYFVGNFNGDGGERDGNGFISRVSAEDGTILDLRFAVGGPDAPFHAPRGMYITGDTLWAVDVDGLHGFNRETGAPLSFIDLSSFEPGFLNDVSQGPDGALYVTDTGRSAVYRVAGRETAEAVVDAALGSPNGIVRDGFGEGFFLLPWEPGHPVHRWVPGEAFVPFGPETTEGRLDGAEMVSAGRLLVASQSDESLHLMDASGTRVVITTGGRPADIGLDTRRNRVAVPYISLDRVDVWQLPSPGTDGS